MRFGLIYAALATGALARPRAKPQICGQAGLQWAEYDNTQGPDLGEFLTYLSAACMQPVD